MNALRTLFLLAAGLSVALSTNDKALNQFKDVILCTMPDSRPNFDYGDYGCYCGKGGSGKPVDKLDRCCQVHDKCYIEHNECTSFTKFYSYSCDKASKTLTCNGKKDACGWFICECDRKAAECFAKSPYNPEHKQLPSDQCQ